MSDCARARGCQTLPGGEVTTCPWSCAHSRSGMHVLVSMGGSAPASVAEYVVELAARHGLACYDPQGPDLYLPPGLRAAGPFRFAPIAVTFDEAQEGFRKFAADHGYPGELLWTCAGELTIFRKRIVVLGGDASVRRERARARYEQGARSGYGVGMAAIGMSGGRTAATKKVQVLGEPE